MKLKLKDIKRLLPEKLDKDWDGKFKLGFIKAIDLIGSRQLEVSVCMECVGLRIAGNKTFKCPKCFNGSGVVVEAINE